MSTRQPAVPDKKKVFFREMLSADTGIRNFIIFFNQFFSHNSPLILGIISASPTYYN